MSRLNLSSSSGSTHAPPAAAVSLAWATGGKSGPAASRQALVPCQSTPWKPEARPRSARRSLSPSSASASGRELRSSPSMSSRLPLEPLLSSPRPPPGPPLSPSSPCGRYRHKRAARDGQHLPGLDGRLTAERPSCRPSSQGRTAPTSQETSLSGRPETSSRSDNRENRQPRTLCRPVRLLLRICVTRQN